jgi:dTDP-4-dehydrorhamnose 3,5-epimerase
MLKGAEKRAQTVTSKWEKTHKLIDGVTTKDIRNVVSPNAVVTEAYRSDWGLHVDTVHQVSIFTFHPRAIAAWDLHEHQSDNVICVNGLVRLVLYDGREQSPTCGDVNIFQLSHVRPTLVSIPPNVWHGFQNMLDESSITLVAVDRAFNHAKPDSWRLPYDSQEIPYQFVP